MTLDEYLASPESKYAVILKSVYLTDSVARTISDSPREFTLNDVEYVILSIEPNNVQTLVGYLISLGTPIEYSFIQGTGAIKLLIHSQVLALIES